MVDIFELPQLGLHGGDADSGDAPYDDVLAEEPKSEANVMDVAVDKDVAGKLGVGNVKAGGTELIADLGAEDGGSSDGAGVHVVEGISEGCVEPVGETAHDLQT